MKRVTKVTAFLLALVLVLGCSLSALASSVDGELPSETEIESATEPASEIPEETEEEPPAEENESPTESETATESEPEATFFEELMAAESCEALFQLMMRDPDACLELTDDQLVQLEAKVLDMEDDGYQADVLDTIMYLRNPDGQAETYAEDEAEATFFEELMAAESCEALFQLMMRDPDACLELTDDQLVQLEAKVLGMEDDGYQVDVQDTVAYLLNPDEQIATPYANGVPDLTIPAGSSGTISNVSNYNDWRVVDANGNEVETVTATRQRNQGSSYLTVTASEDATPGTYTIQYRSGGGGPGGGGGTYANAYTVQVTEYHYSSGVDGTIQKGNGGGSSSTTTEPTPSVTKTATKTSESDYTYDLALTVSSSVGSSESKVAIDLLFIIDKSGSMDSDHNNVMEETKQAVIGLTNALAANENLDMQFAVVAFSGSTSGNGKYDDADTVQDWTKSATAVSGSVNNISATGGTNYEAGLRTGKQVLLNARPTAYKYVIFLSDGAPGYYYDGDGYTAGSGSSINNTAVAHAEYMVKELVGINGLYTVYVTSDDTTTGNQQYLQKLTAAIRSADSTVDTDDQVYVKGQGGNLSDLFKDFSKNFTQISCTDASVVDTLSEWVEPVENAEPYVVIRVKNADGSETKYSSKAGNIPEAELGITARLDGKVLTLDFPDDYELKENYVYEVHLDIQPSQAAINRGTDYPDTSDANTGTHSTDKGYYSNVSARLDYMVEGMSKYVNYPYPVVQVPAATTVTITKQVTGNMGDTSKEFSFTVTSDKEMGKAKNNEYTLSEDGMTATFTLSDDESVTLQDVKKGATLTISETGANGYTMTVKVGDVDLVKDESGRYTYTVPQDSTEPISIIVTNTKNVTIDTGILLDAVPYVLLLAVAAAGVVLLLVRRRRGSEG